MKLSLCILTSLLLAVVVSGNPEDFPFYITDDGHVFQEMTNGGRFIRPQKIREAMKAKESRPAKLDPEGNWGPVAFGSQVSLRFSKSEFSASEPITATLIVRNVSDQAVEFAFRFPDAATSLIVTGPSGAALERTDISKPADPRIAAVQKAVTAKGEAYWLIPGMQRQFEVNLKSHWNVSMPGRYQLYVEPTVFDWETRKLTPVSSRKVAITVSGWASDATNAPAANSEK